jgi:WD40 repeat protein
MKNIPLLALGFILATYNLCAMELQGKRPKKPIEDQQIQTRAAEDAWLTDIRDRALLTVAQNGYLHPEMLGPQFCQNFTTLAIKKFGISKDIKPRIQQEVAWGTNFVFSPCGRFYAFSSGRDIITRNIYTGLGLKVKTNFGAIGVPDTLIFSPDSSSLYARYVNGIYPDQNTMVLQIDIGKQQTKHFSCEKGSWLNFKKFNPHIVLKNFTEPIWHSKKKYSIRFSRYKVSYPLAISPDGSLLVFKKYGILRSTIIIWNLAHKKVVKRLKSHRDHHIKRIIFSNTGRLLIGISDTFAYIWDTKNWALINIIKIATAEKQRISISHNNHFLASCNEEGVNIYDIKTGDFIQTIAHECESKGLERLIRYKIKTRGPIQALTFNHYGQLSTETYDNTIRTWDMMPLPARIAFRSLSMNQLLVLMILVKPLAAGRVIHLTPGSPSWNLVHTMPEEIKTLLDPCLKPVGIVTTLTRAVRECVLLIAASIFKKQ